MRVGQGSTWTTTDDEFPTLRRKVTWSQLRAWSLPRSVVTGKTIWLGQKAWRRQEDHVMGDTTYHWYVTWVTTDEYLLMKLKGEI